MLSMDMHINCFVLYCRGNGIYGPLPRFFSGGLQAKGKCGGSDAQYRSRKDAKCSVVIYNKYKPFAGVVFGSSIFLF